MKKVVIVFLLILLIIPITKLKDKNMIKNNKYQDELVELYYPSFNNKKIDNYINNYLTSVIANNKDYSIYIDYDYIEKKDIIKLEFYQNINSNNLEIRNNKTFNIDTKNKKVYDTNNSIDYDIYQNKVVSNNEKVIAFTFDDGPNHNTVKILNILKKYNSTATFFVLGNKIKGNEKKLKLMQEYGMEIGNHTYSHPLLSKATTDEIADEIKKTNDLIYEVTNTYPSLFRSSYGTFNNKIRKSINMPIIIWNIDTLDWKHHSANIISNKILNNVSDGDIILMHDIYTSTVNAIEIVVPKLIDKGYKIVSVSELFYLKNIELKNGVVYGKAG